MNCKEFWIIVFVLGVCTFSIRYSFLAIAGGAHKSSLFGRFLKFIPASVFAALAVPALVYVKSSGEYAVYEWERLVAGGVALAIAFLSKNVLITIVSGMGVLWFLKYLF